MATFRKNIFPRRIGDWFCFVIMTFAVPAILIFDLMVVVPVIHLPGSFLYSFTFAVGVFLAFNITANWIASVCIDTSVQFETLSPPPNADTLGWRFCKHCNKMAPPRSWHCKICGCCILKRDHHCLFTGCCIGHKNQRYFMTFVLLLFIGSTYALAYNSYYLWVLNARIYRNWLSLFKTLCPLLFLVSGSIRQNFYLVLFNLNLLGFIYATTLMLYHGLNILSGAVCFERRGKHNRYNLGWRKNLKMVFGNRAFMVWLNPLVKSQLPSDGTEWRTNEYMQATEVTNDKIK